MRTRDKIVLNGLLAGIVAVGYMIYRHLVHGDRIDVEFLYILPFFVPVMGFVLWLRWDWARDKNREVRAQRKAEKDAETFE